MSVVELLKVLEQAKLELAGSSKDKFEYGDLVCCKSKEEFGIVLCKLPMICRKEALGTSERYVILSMSDVEEDGPDRGEKKFRIRYPTAKDLSLVNDKDSKKLKKDISSDLHRFCSEQCIMDCSEVCFLHKFKKN